MPLRAATAKLPRSCIAAMQYAALPLSPKLGQMAPAARYRGRVKPYHETDVHPEFIEVVGMLAAALTTSAFFPQAVKTIRTGETAGLSLAMYLMLVGGVTMWLAYGLLIGSLPLILANGIVLLPQAMILSLMLVRRRPGGAVSRAAPSGEAGSRMKAA